MHGQAVFRFYLEPQVTSLSLLPRLQLKAYVCWLVGCLTSQQHASVSQGRICADNFTCCHAETEVADHTFYLTQSQYTDTGPTSPSADPIMPGAWQGSHWSANFEVTGMTRPGKIPSQAGFEPRAFRSRGGRLNHKASEAVAEGNVHRNKGNIDRNRRTSLMSVMRQVMNTLGTVFAGRGGCH